MNAPDDAERRRIVCVTMAKASARLGMGIVMWWAGVLKGGPEIDVTAIKARRGNAKPAANQSGAGSAGSKKTFSEVYAEAQEMFKAKMRREEKGTPGDNRTVVTLPDEGDSDEEGEEDVAGLGVDGIEAAAAAAADAQTNRSHKRRQQKVGRTCTLNAKRNAACSLALLLDSERGLLSRL